MTYKELKDFLKASLIDGYEPIREMHGFKSISNEEIKEAIDTLPVYEGEPMESFLTFLDYYILILEDIEEYKLQYKIVKTARHTYGSSLMHNYYHATRFGHNMFLDKKDNKNNENVDKNDENCYNNSEDDSLSRYKIDLDAIKCMMRIRGITYEKLASMLKVSTRSIDRKLSGVTEFKAIELARIMKILDMDIDTILKEEI